MANKQQDFLGKGMKFPPEVNRATGRIVVSEGEKSVKESLALVGMGEEYYNKSPFELSGGQKRRVAIAGVMRKHWKA